MELRKIKVEALRDAIKKGRIVWRKHALERMLEQEITIEQVINCILNGEVVKEYLDDRPFPSVLFLKDDNLLPLHVVSSFNEKEKNVYIITTYYPSIEFYEIDFKTRKQYYE